MLLSVLGLLLAGAEPSSYGVLNYGTGSPLDGDTSQGYATDILTKGQARPVFLQLLKLLHGYSKHPVADLED